MHGYVHCRKRITLFLSAWYIRIKYIMQFQLKQVRQQKETKNGRRTSIVHILTVVVCTRHTQFHFISLYVIQFAVNYFCMMQQPPQKNSMGLAAAVRVHHSIIVLIHSTRMACLLACLFVGLLLFLFQSLPVLACFFHCHEIIRDIFLQR